MLGLIAISPETAEAKAAVKTRDEAVAWLNQQGGKTYGDGQCVALVRAYVNWLVNGSTGTQANWGLYKKGDGISGDGRDIWKNLLWSEMEWRVYENTADFVPEPGDIFSSGISSGNHTGVVVSSNVSKATVVDCNLTAPYNGGPCSVHEISWKYSSNDTAYAATHFIRPVFKAAATTGVQGKLNTVKGVYPSGSFFTVASSTSGCTSSNHDILNGEWCMGCYLPNIPARGGLPSGSSVGFIADTCCGFANYVFYCTFGHRALDSEITSSKPALGDMVFTGKHYFIYLSEDSSNYYVYDANGYDGGKNKVLYNNTYPKSEVTNLTVWHASNYSTVNGSGSSATTVHITLNANGGTVGTSGFYYKVGTDKYYSDAACTKQITKITPPTRAGYVFEHYYGDGSCGGANGERYIYGASSNNTVVGSFAEDLDDDITKDAVLYAKWSVCSHSYTSKVTKQPTCTVTGVKTFTCSVCGASYTETIKALGHSYSAVVTPPTATSQGYTTHTCSRCNNSYIDSYTNPIPSPDSHSERIARVFGSGGKVRSSGIDRYKTAVSTADYLKGTLTRSSFDSIIIACGTNFPDALAGSYLAAKKSAPILMVGKDGAGLEDAANYVKANLAADGEVYILGGTGAVPAAVEKALSGYCIMRISGRDRYETNLQILNEAGISNGADLLIVDAQNFADALSASALGKPILLVNKTTKTLTAEQKQILGRFGHIYILGGAGAVPEELVKEIEKTSGITPVRIGGKSRYETSVNIAKTFFANPDCITIATGSNYPDGLTGGSLAYALDAPLILLDKGTNDAAREYFGLTGCTKVLTYGGTGSVPEATINAILK